MSPTPPPPDPAIFSRNHEALRLADPNLAGRLAELDLTPFNPTPARTRDGRTSFRLSRHGGRPEWLGRTSIPTVRASALLEQFDPGQGNVLLPSFGEGSEVHTLLEKLVPRVVFVWEPDLVSIRLALSLRDFAPSLTMGRFVILQCPTETLTQTLSDWLIRHPNVECPSRLLMWPWQTQAELAEVRSAVEAAWQQRCQYKP